MGLRLGGRAEWSLHFRIIVVPISVRLLDNHWILRPAINNTFDPKIIVIKNIKFNNNFKSTHFSFGAWNRQFLLHDAEWMVPINRMLASVQIDSWYWIDSWTDLYAQRNSVYDVPSFRTSRLFMSSIGAYKLYDASWIFFHFFSFSLLFHRLRFHRFLRFVMMYYYFTVFYWLSDNGFVVVVCLRSCTMCAAVLCTHIVYSSCVFVDSVFLW